MTIRGVVVTVDEADIVRADPDTPSSGLITLTQGKAKIILPRLAAHSLAFVLLRLIGTMSHYSEPTTNVRARRKRG